MPAAAQSVVCRRKTGKAMIQGDRELIDAYLRGSMSPAERLVFETRLQTDAVLKKETDAVLLILPLIHEAGRMSLKTKLRAIEATLPASFEDYSPAKNDKGKLKAKGKFSLKWWWFAVAAGMIAAAVTWYVFFYQANKEGHHECPDCSEQTAPAQPAINETELRRIADSLYTDSCMKDTAGINPQPAGVKADVYDPNSNSFEDLTASGSPPKTPATNTPTIIEARDSIPLYSSAWQIHDKAVIVGSDVKQKNPVVISVQNTGNNKFHYRYTDDTLTLYGPFVRNLLFYDQSGNRLVLRYKEKYYPLPPTAKIQPLTEGPVLGASRSTKK